jgi:hypothetical protein
VLAPAIAAMEAPITALLADHGERAGANAR